MVRVGVLYLLAVSVLTVTAAPNVNLSGKVTTKNGQPVSGAIVTIVGAKLRDTTTGNGEYSIISTGTVVGMNSPVTSQVTFSNGIIDLTLSRESPVIIDLFDVRGVLLKRVLEHSVPSGRYRYSLFNELPAAKVIAIRVSCSGRVTTFRYIPLKNGRSAASFFTSRSGEARAGTAKLMATVDTLKVSAAGFSSATVLLSTYDGKVDVTFDQNAAVELDKFSFFVTSLRAMQDLSKSEDGFGGDFRFGKTGKGAGLLGADSICSCIAERSMEGASAKKWRAFLSVAVGRVGKLVNAIDRIGEGPWYDRLGRIVANNRSELLQDRPAGAHSAIKNDLPNEDGVPNHRPDPNQPAVDNHLTVTGSNEKGQLFNPETDETGFGGFGGGIPGMSGGQESENPTCNDWTSTTVKSTPRAGLCWPQAGGMGMGMSNWISVWNQSGCEPGIDLETMTGSGRPGVYTIGNGGGYGGFYCFALIP